MLTINNDEIDSKLIVNREVDEMKEPRWWQRILFFLDEKWHWCFCRHEWEGISVPRDWERYSGVVSCLKCGCSVEVDIELSHVLGVED